MKTQEIKKKFLESFENKGHKILPSGSTLTHNDPTLLFVNAGMNQFKEYFLGEQKAKDSKVTTSQKCIRVGGKHNDLDNVGHTNRHLTFFEMLGNFSFGDYFKKEAIEMAFHVSTEVLGLDPKQIFISVFKEDFEAFEIWKQFMPESQICFMGEEDNYWAMGDSGPCGPCSELYFDKGVGFGDYKTPAHDPDGHRFLEFWNLVFMEFNKDESGKKTPLPSPCIDTGMGLERMTAILNGKDSVFETNIFEALIKKLSEKTKIPYEANKAAYHVVCDHLRALSFAIADGAAPSNVDRGYVLRKVLRRATRYARQLSITKPFMADLFPTLLNEMVQDFPELEKSSHRICDLLTQEEESFIKTLSRGGNILQSIIDKSKASDMKEISGKDAFVLKDTYGFPIEEICLLAKDHHLEVNLDTFEILEEEAKEKSKKAHKSHSQQVKENIFPEFVEKHGSSEFLREKSSHEKAVITGILHNGDFVNTLEKGQRGGIILDKTPFYAEMGGQRGDLGKLFHKGAQFHVEDCKSPYSGVIMHEGVLQEGTLLVGEPVSAEIETHKRLHIEKNHTATHMLHYALEKVLGEHIKQAGSYVSEKSLRLDFTHHKKVEESEIEQIEEMINEAIFKGWDVTIKEMSYEDVKNNTSIKQLFGEKYSDTVRLVSVGDFSKELCGGTHVKNTAQIGLFKIVKEMSVAGGVRRIEAVTSKEALAFIKEKEELLKQMCKTIGTPEPKALDALSKLTHEYKEAKSDLKKLKKEQMKNMTDHLLNEKQTIGGINFITKEVSMDSKEFSTFATELLGRLKDGIVILANNHPTGTQIHIQKTKSATTIPSAKKLLDEVLPIIEGKGGGSEICARGQASSPQNLAKALSHITSLLK